MNRTTRIAHTASVVLMGLGVLVATADGFAQSYAGLHTWATEQGLKGWKADSFPLLVDLFVIVGECGLFALALEGHRLTRRGLSWVDVALPFGLAAGGWGVSLAFNVGAAKDDISHQVTASVAPIASMLGLLVLLRTLHRLVSRMDLQPGSSTSVTAETGEADAPGESLNGATVALPAPRDEAPVPAVPDAQEAVPAVQIPGPVNSHPVLAPVSEVADLRMRAAREFADDVTAGRVPGIRAIRQQLKIGQPRAQDVRAYLSTLANQ